MKRVLFLRPFGDNAHTYYLHVNMMMLWERTKERMKSITSIWYDFDANRNVPFDFSEYNFDIFFFDCGDGMGNPTLEETLEKLANYADLHPDKQFYVYHHMPFRFDRTKFKRKNLFI